MSGIAQAKRTVLEPIHNWKGVDMRVSLRRVATVLVAVIALVAPVLPTTPTAPMASAAPTIPTPEQYFGYRIGSDGRLAMLDQMVPYFKLIADRSNKVD